MKTSLVCAAAAAILCLAGCGTDARVLSRTGPQAMDSNALRASGVPNQAEVREPRGTVIGSVDFTVAQSRQEVQFGDDRITVFTHPITWNDPKRENLGYRFVEKDRIQFNYLISLRGCGPVSIWQGNKCLTYMAGKVPWILAGHNLRQAVLFTLYQAPKSDASFEVQATPLAPLPPGKKSVGLNLVWLDNPPDGYHYDGEISSETDQDRPRIIRFISWDFSYNPWKATLFLNETGGYDWPREDIIAPPIRLPSDAAESKKF